VPSLRNSGNGSWDIFSKTTVLTLALAQCETSVLAPMPDSATKIRAKCVKMYARK
jgi:hypothetical protein